MILKLQSYSTLTFNMKYLNTLKPANSNKLKITKIQEKTKLSKLFFSYSGNHIYELKKLKTDRNNKLFALIKIITITNLKKFFYYLPKNKTI